MKVRMNNKYYETYIDFQPTNLVILDMPKDLQPSDLQLIELMGVRIDEIENDDGEIEEVETEIVLWSAEGYIYVYRILDNGMYELTDDPTNVYLEPPLIELQTQKQEENKLLFKEFLENQTVHFKGKEYGVTEEDQTEMTGNLGAYQIEVQAGVPNPILQWHSKKHACVDFELEDFITLIIMIKGFVMPYFNLMQSYKEQIYQTTSKEELNAIELAYVLPNESEGE